MVSKTQRSRQLIEAPKILIQPGIHGAFSATLVEQMGFKSAAISCAGLGKTNVGWADGELVGFDENLHASRTIAACIDIPVSADAGTGYGNVINEHFTVRGFEVEGVDGIMLEDQGWPKRCGHMAGREVIERPDLAVPFREQHEQMGFGAIEDMEQRLPTAPRKQAKYGAAAQ